MLFNLSPQLLIILVISLLLALTLHEFGHAFIAYLCGDNTAKKSGRMSLNPIVHLDIIGSLMILFVGFGYARPVPVNPNNYKVRNADFFVAVAGPAVNFFLGFFGTFILRILAENNLSYLANFPIIEFIYFFILINFNLCLFNLIPLGPLDGNSVFTHFLPSELKIRFQYWNNRYGSQALMALVLISIILPGFSAFSWISKISKNMIQFLI